MIERESILLNCGVGVGYQFRISWSMKRTNDSVLQEVQHKTRLFCLIQSQMLSYFVHIARKERMETVSRKSSFKDELKGAESLEDPGPDGLAK